jgi:zona occludens toxin
MSINCYSGLQGSGKSYEVVSSIIVPAVTQGRRVVTNISGIDNDGIRAYCCEKLDVPMDKLGSVVYAKNEEVSSRDFFPTEDTAQQADGKPFVLPGDLVAVDEAYKIWGSDCKIHNEHKVFFREHRHYIHPQTGVACDLVLMTQDIGDLHRVLKVVIEQSFKTHKAKGVGMNNVYTITMWEGWKQHQKNIVKDWTQTYNPEIFPLYKSYAGEQQGKEMASDSRQNVFADKRLLYKIAFLLIAGSFAVWKLWHFFGDKMHSGSTAATLAPATSALGGRATPLQPDYSADWRIVGVLDVGGVRQIVLAGANGVRLDNGIYYTGAGLSLSGTVDGKKVTRFSGSAPSTSLSKGKKEGLVR